MDDALGPLGELVCGVAKLETPGGVPRPLRPRPLVPSADPLSEEERLGLLAEARAVWSVSERSTRSPEPMALFKDCPLMAALVPSFCWEVWMVLTPKSGEAAT